MAIYHLSVKIGGRAKGQSAIAASAYRSGEKLKDYETGLTSDYSRKQRIVCCGIALCENAPEEYADRETLWNAVHKIEKSKDARLWREIEVALPRELNQDEQIATVKEFVNYLTQKGMCADWAIHDSGDGNPHAHIMLTTRSILPNGKWAGKSCKVYDLDENGQRIFQKIDKTGRKQYKCHTESYNDWNDKERVEEWRAVWAECCNARLSEQDRIDHRSYARQGIDQIPTIHEGYAARQRVADGLPSDRVQLNDKIRQQNSLLEDIENQVNAIDSEMQRLYIDKRLSECRKIGFEFPELNSDEYIRMYDEMLHHVQESRVLPLSFVKKYAVKCPQLCSQRTIGKEAAKRLEQRLKEENINFIRLQHETKDEYCYVINFENSESLHQIVQGLRRTKQKQSTPEKTQIQPLSQADIENVISLKNDYATKCLIYHYLRTAHQSTECQENYRFARTRFKMLTEYAREIRELDEQIKKTINPFKKKSLLDTRRETYEVLEDVADMLKSALNISLAYEGRDLSYQTLTQEHLNAIIGYTYSPLRKLKQDSENEIKRNERIAKLNSLQIDDNSVKLALHEFRNACTALTSRSDEDRQRVYSALINDKVPPMDFEVSGYLSKGRQTAMKHIAEIISTIKPNVLSSQPEQVQECEQDLSVSHKNRGHTM